MTEKEMDDFLEAEELTNQKILYTLLDGKENIDLKTRIFKPKKMALLHTYIQRKERKGYVKCAKTLSIFEQKLLRYLVSLRGLSRKETIDGITLARENFTKSSNEINSNVR